MSNRVSSWIMFLFGAMLCVAEETLVGISLTNIASPGQSIGQHTATVWFNQKVYQCDYTPSLVQTTYSCDASSWIGCDDTIPVDEAKILFDNAHIDASIYSSIVITTTEAYYAIHGVCIPDSATIGGHYPAETLGGTCASGSTNYRFCIDGEDASSSGSCWPPQQMIYFDTTKPDQSIGNAVWEPAQSFVVSADNCGFGIDETLLQIGITTSSSPSQSPAEHTLTVWFKQKVYQCKQTPSLVHTTYTCGASSFIGCDPSSASDGAKILFDNTHEDASLYSRIWITTTEAEYGISGVCIPDSATIGGHLRTNEKAGQGSCAPGSSYYKRFCIDGEVASSGGSCWPPQQMLYFDTARPNVDIDNALWEDAQSFDISTDDYDCGCDASGLGLAVKPHACECQARSECAEGDLFCNSMDLVLNALDVNGVEGFCPGFATCCCSCENCPGFAEL